MSAIAAAGKEEEVVATAHDIANTRFLQFNTLLGTIVVLETRGRNANRRDSIKRKPLYYHFGRFLK